MRKQWKVFFLFSVCFTLLFSCSNDEKKEDLKPEKETENTEEKKQDEESPEPEKDEDADDTAKEEVKEEEKLTEILAKATEVNEAFDNFSEETITDTIETFNDEMNHLVATNTRDVRLDLTQVEIVIEQEQMDDSDHPAKDFFAQKGHIYMMEDVQYVYMDEGQQWYKSKSDYTAEELSKNEGIHVQKLYESYQEIAETEHFEETDTEYLIQFEFDLAAATDLDKEREKDQEWVYNDESFQSYEVEKYTAELAIDKETFYLNTVKTNKVFSYDMQFQDSDGKMVKEREIISTFKNHNQVEEIKVPQEISENAKEL